MSRCFAGLRRCATQFGQQAAHASGEKWRERGDARIVERDRMRVHDAVASSAGNPASRRSCPTIACSNAAATSRLSGQ